MKQRFLYIYYYLKHIHHKIREKFIGRYNILENLWAFPLPATRS